METITITMHTGNEAFQTEEDVSRMLRKVASRFDVLGMNIMRGMALRDDNGNVVGRVAVDVIPADALPG